MVTRNPLAPYSNAVFYLEDTDVAWQCTVHSERLIKNQNIPCRAKGHEIATCALLRPPRAHQTQCDEYATRGPAKRLKCVTRGVSYAVCWRANSSEVLLINQKWRFRKNIDTNRAVTPYFYFIILSKEDLPSSFTRFEINTNFNER